MLSENALRIKFYYHHYVTKLLCLMMKGIIKLEDCRLITPARGARWFKKVREKAYDHLNFGWKCIDELKLRRAIRRAKDV